MDHEVKGHGLLGELGPTLKPEGGAHTLDIGDPSPVVPPVVAFHQVEVLLVTDLSDGLYLEFVQHDLALQHPFLFCIGVNC